MNRYILYRGDKSRIYFHLCEFWPPHDGIWGHQAELENSPDIIVQKAILYVRSPRPKRLLKSINPNNRLENK